MAEMTRDELKLIFAEVLESRSNIDPIRHKTHHDYVENMVARAARRRDNWEKVKVNVLGWGAIAIIVFVAKVFGEWILNHFPFNGKPN